MKKEHLKELFKLHNPTPDQAERMHKIRSLGLKVAELINDLAPESAEQTKAIRHVESAVMWANKAIVVNEFVPKPEPLDGPIGGDEDEPK